MHFFGGVNIAGKMHYASFTISLIQVIFACVVYGENCFSDENLSPQKVVMSVKYNMIFAFCKFVFNLGLTISLCFYSNCREEEETCELQKIEKERCKEKTNQINCIKFIIGSKIILNIFMILWKSAVIACLIPLVGKEKTAYFYVVGIIVAFYTKYIFSFRELFGILINTSPSAIWAINYIVKYVIAMFNVGFTVTLLVMHNEINLESKTEKIIYSFDFVFLNVELCITVCDIIYNMIIIGQHEFINMDTRKSYYDLEKHKNYVKLSFIHLMKKYLEEHNKINEDLTDKIKKIHYAFSQVIELISIISYVSIICIVGYYTNEINAPRCGNFEIYALSLFNIQFYSFIIGSFIGFRYIVFIGSRIFTKVSKEKMCLILELIHFGMISSELIIVVVLLLCQCHIDSNTPLSYFLNMNYLCVYLRFIFWTDWSESRRFLISLVFEETEKKIFNFVMKIILANCFVFSIVGWGICAYYLNTSDMNKYGVIDNLVNKTGNVAYQRNNGEFLYDKDGEPLNVYDGKSDEDEDKCKLCRHHDNREYFYCLQRRCGKPFRLRDWFIANYTFIFLDYLIQILFIFSLCFVTSYMSGFIVINAFLMITMNISIMAVTYVSPDGSLFKYLQSPIKNILFVHIYLQIPILFFAKTCIMYIMYM